MSFDPQVPLIKGNLGMENTNFHFYIKKFSDPYSVITYDHSSFVDKERDVKLLSVQNEQPELSKHSQ